MKHPLLLFLIILSNTLYAQKSHNKYELRISDNQGLQYQSVKYHITPDSLVISGLSDYGKSEVDYLRRKLTLTERDSLVSFLSRFPLDSFQDVYFKDYSNMAFISPENYPRVIDLDLTNLGTSKKIRINNMFVPRFSELFQAINPLFPNEVRINYQAKDFEKKER